MEVFQIGDKFLSEDIVFARLYQAKGNVAVPKNTIWEITKVLGPWTINLTAKQYHYHITTVNPELGDLVARMPHDYLQENFILLGE